MAPVENVIPEAIPNKEINKKSLLRPGNNYDTYITTLP
jgi:hypothetical protein